DERFIRRIKKIVVRPRIISIPPGVQERTIPTSPPLLVFYKEAKPGDIKKFREVSNVAQSGGGARDLRVSPAALFQPGLQQILSQPGEELFVTQGLVHWRNK